MEYVGTNYAGYQSQDGKLTVQSTLERAASAVTQETIRVEAAGRTDAGAHALGQVVSFVTHSRLATETLQSGMNHYLPSDIVVRDVSEVALDFHPRYDATSRIYRYLIWNHPVRSPLWAERAAHVPRPLDVPAMNAAAGRLIGRHDFGAFVASTAQGGRVRSMYRAECRREGDLVVLVLEASGFMQQMARAIAGTLILVGQGKLRPDDIDEILSSCDRSRAGDTAPACGLYLAEVRYEPRLSETERLSPDKGGMDEENE